MRRSLAMLPLALLLVLALAAPPAAALSKPYCRNQYGLYYCQDVEEAAGVVWYVGVAGLGVVLVATGFVDDHGAGMDVTTGALGHELEASATICVQDGKAWLSWTTCADPAGPVVVPAPVDPGLLVLP